MNKTKKNLIFILLVILLISVIICFNYHKDSYSIFHKRKNMSECINKTHLINIYLKAYKNVKSDTLIIGSSDGYTLFAMDYILKNKGNYIFGINNYEHYYKILKRYLELHPETKQVVLIINYMLLLGNSINEFPNPQYSGNHLNLKDLSYLLLSYDITKQNLNKNGNNVNDEFKYYFAEMHPYGIDLRLEIPQIIKNKNTNFYYINLILDLLNSKNIEYKVVIPPYHAYYLSRIYKNNSLYSIITDLKKLLVNKCPNIYDMAFINKYTSQPFFEVEKYNYYYSTPVHPNIILGSKLYRILFDNQNAEDKEIYLKLTKEDFEKQMENETKLLNKYFKENKEKIDKYYKDAEGKQFDEYTIPYEKTMKEMPEDVAQEFEYLKKISK